MGALLMAKALALLTIVILAIIAVCQIVGRLLDAFDIDFNDEEY